MLFLQLKKSYLNLIFYHTPVRSSSCKDTDIKPMLMNLKEGGYSVVNRVEDLTTVDESLVEKKWTIMLEPQAWQEEEVWHRTCAIGWMEQKLSLDNESEYGDAIFRVQDQEVTTYRLQTLYENIDVVAKDGLRPGAISRAGPRRLEEAAAIRCGRGKRRIATATTTWAARADERGGNSGMWRSNAGATVGGYCQSGTLRRRAGGWSPEDTVESTAMWRRRGVVGVACDVAKGQRQW
ncbi:hypothetical protein GW17_00050660 [Ensete ventricosum]|nr:hypothetical protein GW17_00050660 [Ensete ventricosum]